MKWVTILIIAIIIFTLGFWWVKYLRPIHPLKEGEIAIKERPFKVEVVSSAPDRERGLSGRDSLPPDYGMLFIFPTSGRHGFWMRDMKFPIDMIWIKGSEIVGVTPDVYPEFEAPLWKLTIYYPPEAVDRVLEVSAGTARQYQWQAGDVIDMSKLGL